MLSFFLSLLLLAAPFNGQEFPLIGINLDSTDLRDTSSTFDIAAYYTGYTPDPEAATALNEAKAKAMLDEAFLTSMSVLVELPVLANGSVSPSGTIIPTTSIVAPTTKNEITTAYSDYWATQAATSVQSLLAYSHAAQIAGWYGQEEIRYWEGARDYYTTDKFVDVLTTYDASFPASRQLVAYEPMNYLAADALVYTLLKYASTSSVPKTLDPDPYYTYKLLAGARANYYPKDLTFYDAGGGALKPLQSHVIQGNYAQLALGEYGHTNRLLGLHRIESMLEAARNADTASGVTLTNIVLHAPDLTYSAPADMTAAEARHDFWVGIHKAQGVFIYNYAYRSRAPLVWTQYRRGLRLIKYGGLRDFLTAQTTPAAITLTTSGAQEIDGLDYYFVNLSTDPSYILPDYNPVTATLFDNDGVGGVAYLIVTNSYASPQTVTVDVGHTILTIKEQVGSGTSTIVAGDLVDTFDGIDGRVYRITY